MVRQKRLKSIDGQMHATPQAASLSVGQSISSTLASFFLHDQNLLHLSKPSTKLRIIILKHSET